MVRAYETDEGVLEGFAAGAQFAQRSGSDDAALVDDGHAIAEALHYFQHVRGEKDGGAALHLVE